MNLDGRLDIIIKEISPDKTKVTVNTEYVLTKSITSIDVHGNKKSSEDSISFNTGKSDEFPGDKICICNGMLEKEVLSMLVFLD
jgi:hypothetical protein